MIEHLAISGAGPAGIIQLGMIQHALEESIFSMDNIKSIHGSSAGAIISLLLCIGVPIEEMVEYFVLRPWNKWLSYDVTHFYENKGIVSSECFSELVEPFFNAYNLSTDMTLHDLFIHSGKELFIYTTHMPTLDSIALHHLTYPDLPAIHAIMMSANVPVLFTPFKYKEEYYIDGGVRLHCPFIPQPEDTVLNIYISYAPAFNIEDTQAYFSYLMLQMAYIVTNNRCPPKGHIIQYTEYSFSDILFWKKCIYEEEFRRELIEIGKRSTRIYLENKT